MKFYLFILLGFSSLSLLAASRSIRLFDLSSILLIFNCPPKLYLFRYKFFAFVISLSFIHAFFGLFDSSLFFRIPYIVRTLQLFFLFIFCLSFLRANTPFYALRNYAFGLISFTLISLLSLRIDFIPSTLFPAPQDIAQSVCILCFYINFNFQHLFRSISVSLFIGFISFNALCFFLVLLLLGLTVKSYLFLAFVSFIYRVVFFLSSNKSSRMYSLFLSALLSCISIALVLSIPYFYLFFADLYSIFIKWGLNSNQMYLS